MENYFSEYYPNEIIQFYTLKEDSNTCLSHRVTSYGQR